MGEMTLNNLIFVDSFPVFKGYENFLIFFISFDLDHKWMMYFPLNLLLLKVLLSSLSEVSSIDASKLSVHSLPRIPPQYHKEPEQYQYNTISEYAQVN